MLAVAILTIQAAVLGINVKCAVWSGVEDVTVVRIEWVFVKYGFAETNDLLLFVKTSLSFLGTNF